MAELADLGDVSLTFVPRIGVRHFENAPAGAPAAEVDHGRPMLRGGLWPFIAEDGGVDDFLPADFLSR